MRRLHAIATDERGTAIVLGLVALLTLTTLMLAFVSVSAFEPQIAANLAASTQARYLAEAGVEAAFDGLANAGDWSTAIADATCTTGAIAPATTAASALPGRPSAAGTFTARVRNDCFAGTAAAARDRVLTGLPEEDRGGARADTNHRLVIESTGTVGRASRTVTAVVRKVVLPPINAALAFPGTSATVQLGSPLTVNGADTRMGSDASGIGRAVLGIAVGQAANVSSVERALAAHPETLVMGKNDLVPGTLSTGAHAVAHDDALTSAAVAEFVNAIRRSADIAITSTTASPYAIRGMGTSCTAGADSPTCWGTTAHPKIVYVKGDGAGTFPALAVSGDFSGAGILVVEDGALDISGSFRWNGPVIVTGRGVKVRFHGGSAERRAIWGSLIVNETTAGAGPALESDGGTPTISYSTEAIDAVLRGLGARRLMTLTAWQER